MKPDLTEILWKGVLIGHVKDLKVDNFDVYGEWCPLGSHETEEFLSAINSGAEDVVVRIGRAEPPWFGTVESAPDQELEIKSRPVVSEK